MSKSFILGAGFSNAFSESMPTMAELSEHVKDQIEQLPSSGDNHALYRKLLSVPGGIENLLSYLSQAMPWKRPEENDLDRAVFKRVLDLIATFISHREEQAFDYPESSEPWANFPPWTKPFAEYLHQDKPIVASLNYDTVLERVSWTLLSDRAADIYFRIPISDLRLRTGPYYSVPEPDRTYKLLKLHGSINWYFGGEESIPGQQVYYAPILTKSPIEDYKDNPIMEINTLDLTRLIIPPVTEKASFYATNLIKTSWIELRNAIDKANEIYCIGYSLPKTDHTMQLFLSTIADYRDKAIHIVNLPRERESLIEGYSEVFRKNCRELQDNYMYSVEQMVSNLK